MSKKKEVVIASIAAFALVAIIAIYYADKHLYVEPIASKEGAPSEPVATEESDDDRRCESPSRAYSMAQVFVEKRLKSPSTADFPSIFGGDVTTSYLGDCVHHVTAYVDSQNEYGAMVRTHFLAKVQNDYGTTQWVLQDLTIR